MSQEPFDSDHIASLMSLLLDSIVRRRDPSEFYGIVPPRPIFKEDVEQSMKTFHRRLENDKDHDLWISARQKLGEFAEKRGIDTNRDDWTLLAILAAASDHPGLRSNRKLLQRGRRTTDPTRKFKEILGVFWEGERLRALLCVANKLVDVSNAELARAMVFRDAEKIAGQSKDSLKIPGDFADENSIVAAKGYEKKIAKLGETFVANYRKNRIKFNYLHTQSRIERDKWAPTKKELGRYPEWKVKFDTIRARYGVTL